MKPSFKFFGILVTSILSLAARADLTPAETLIDPNAIDRTVNPCDDFYQYACGGWMKNFKLPDDRPSYTRSFVSIIEDNLQVENEILKNYAAGNDSLPAKYADKLGTLYTSCMDTSAIEAVTPMTVAAGIKRIDVLKDKAALPALVARLQLEGAGVFFGFGANSNPKNSDQEVGEFLQGGMGMPSNAHYLDATNKDARKHYFAHVINTFKLAGFSPKVVIAYARTVMGMETRLARGALRQEDLADPRNTTHVTDLKGLRAQFPSFDIDAYLKALDLQGNDAYNVQEPVFLKTVNALIAANSLGAIKVYLKWRWLDSVSNDLGAAYRKEYFNFNDAYLNGQKKMKDRWKYCVGAAEGAMGEALGEAYVNKSFGADGKQKADELISSIRGAFKDNLSNVDWLDQATKDKAAEKLAKVFPKIGYPDHFRNYDNLIIGHSFVNNAVQATSFEARRQLALIGKPVDKTVWAMTPQTVNAYYNPSWNEIVFPAGILQSPFFSKLASDGANFGGIGMVMGHELTHGFDSSGRQFDADGNLVDWWSKSSTDAFNTKTACMVNQFNKYEVVPGTFENGKLTLTENIADLGGIKLSYLAYKKIAATRPAAAPVAGYNEDQQFFVAFAQGWCTVQTDAIAKLYAQTDEHSNARYRVNGTLVNSPPFAQAFGCAKGSKMAPANACSLW